MAQIAVTGGIASGKTLVGRVIAELGFAVWEADESAHAVLVPGHPGASKVRELFGDDILDEDGAIDRRLLGQRVFAEPARLADLNRIVHPFVWEDWRAWCGELEDDANRAAIVPLLYEAGRADGWDAVICVWSPWRARQARLRDRGLADDEIGQRDAAQMPVAEKAHLADFVVSNVGSMELLKGQVEMIVRSILEK